MTNEIEMVRSFYSRMSQPQVIAIAAERMNDIAALTAFSPEYKQICNDMFMSALWADGKISEEEKSFCKYIEKYAGEKNNVKEIMEAVDAWKPVDEAKLIKDFQALHPAAKYMVLRMVFAALAIDGISDSEIAWIKKFI